MAKRGRPLTYKTPGELEEKAMTLLDYAEHAEKVYPTRAWLEVHLNCDLKDYGERKDFSPVVKRIRKRAYSIYEQKAASGEAVPKIAALYLAHSSEEYRDVQQVEVKQDISIDPAVFSSLMDKARAMDSCSRESYIKSLKEIVEDGEEEVD